MAFQLKMGMLAKLLLGIILTQPAWADQDPWASYAAKLRTSSTYGLFKHGFERLKNDINHENLQPDKSCSDVYSKLYSQQATIRMSVIYGYEDQAGDEEDANTVLDPFVAQALRDHLLEPCTGAYSACGFKETSDPAVLTKTIKLANGEIKPVVLTIARSAYSTSHALNTTVYKAEQEQQSAFAEEALVDALKTDQVVFYSGHSRDGGGPDTHPPLLLANGHVNYPLYRARQPGFNTVLNALKERQGPLPFFGNFGCKAVEHFYSPLGKKFSDPPLILGSDTVTDYDAENYVLGGLNAVLSQLCPTEFGKSLNNAEVTEANKFHVYNFFGSSAASAFQTRTASTPVSR